MMVRWTLLPHDDLNGGPVLRGDGIDDRFSDEQPAVCEPSHLRQFSELLQGQECGLVIKETAVCHRRIEKKQYGKFQVAFRMGVNRPCDCFEDVPVKAVLLASLRYRGRDRLAE